MDELRSFRTGLLTTIADYLAVEVLLGRGDVDEWAEAWTYAVMHGGVPCFHVREIVDPPYVVPVLRRLCREDRE